MNIVPVLYSWTLFIHSIQTSFHLLVPNPNPTFFHPTFPWQPPAYSLCLYSCFTDRFICVIFYIPHLSDFIWYLLFSFWLISLTMIISSCIYKIYSCIKYLSDSFLHLLPSLPKKKIKTKKFVYFITNVIEQINIVLTN